MSGALLAAIGRPGPPVERLTEHLYAVPLYPDPEPCEPIRDTETVVDHGARVLLYLLQTDNFGMLSELELDRALHASQFAICARGISVQGADQLAEIRRRIVRTLTRLQGEAQTAIARGLPLGGQLKGGWRPEGGDREPREPKPKDQPPAGTYAELEPLAGSRDHVRF